MPAAPPPPPTFTDLHRALAADDRQGYQRFVEMQQARVELLVRVFAGARAALVTRVFALAHPVAVAGPRDDASVWLTRVALHVLASEAPPAGRLSSELAASSRAARAAYLLTHVLGHSIDDAARILCLSARRTERLVRRASVELGSRLDLARLAAGDVPEADDAPAALRAEADALVLPALDFEAIWAARATGDVERMNTAPILDGEDDPSGAFPAQRATSSRGESLRSLADLASGMPQSRRPKVERDEDSGVVRLSSSSWPEAVPSAPATLPAVTPAAVAAPAPEVRVVEPPVPAAAEPLANSAEVLAVSMDPEPPPPTVKTRVAPPAPRPRRWGWLAAVAALGVGGLAATLVVRAQRPSPIVEEHAAAAPTPAAPAITPAAPTPTETFAVQESAALDPASLPVPAAPIKEPASAPLRADGKSKPVVAAAEPVAASAPVEAKPQPPSGSSLDQAMQNAVGPRESRAGNEPAPAAIPANAPTRPPQGAVTAALGRATSAAKSCVGPDDPISRASVVFVSSGKVQQVSISGYAAGKPAESCMINAMKTASVPPFTDAEYRTTVTLRP